MALIDVVNDVLLRSGVNLPADAVKKYIGDRYQDILSQYEFPHIRRRTFAFSTEAPKTQGTVSVTKGGRLVTGVGTSFASTDVNKLFRVDGARVPYMIAGFTSATSITLDTDYEEETVSGASYKILTHRYALPLDFEWMENVYHPKTGRTLAQVSMRELDELDPQRADVQDNPLRFAIFDNRELEIHPVPNASTRLVVSYFRAVPRITRNSEDSTVIDIDERVLADGAIVDVLRAELARLILQGDNSDMNATKIVAIRALISTYGESFDKGINQIIKRHTRRSTPITAKVIK
jgi:hypothetical protein